LTFEYWLDPAEGRLFRGFGDWLRNGDIEDDETWSGMVVMSWFSGIWSFGLCLLVSTPNTEVHILHTSNNGFSRHKGVYRPVCFATFFMLGEDSFPKHVSPFR